MPHYNIWVTERIPKSICALLRSLKKKNKTRVLTRNAEGRGGLFLVYIGILEIAVQNVAFLTSFDMSFDIASFSCEAAIEKASSGLWKSCCLWFAFYNWPSIWPQFRGTGWLALLMGCEAASDEPSRRNTTCTRLCSSFPACLLDMTQGVLMRLKRGTSGLVSQWKLLCLSRSISWWMTFHQAKAG